MYIQSCSMIFVDEAFICIYMEWIWLVCKRILKIFSGKRQSATLQHVYFFDLEWNAPYGTAWCRFHLTISTMILPVSFLLFVIFFFSTVDFNFFPFFFRVHFWLVLVILTVSIYVFRFYMNVFILLHIHTHTTTTKKRMCGRERRKNIYKIYMLSGWKMWIGSWTLHITSMVSLHMGVNI